MLDDETNLLFQIELNTISSSFAGLTCLVSELHRLSCSYICSCIGSCFVIHLDFVFSIIMYVNLESMVLICFWSFIYAENNKVDSWVHSSISPWYYMVGSFVLECFCVSINLVPSSCWFGLEYVALHPYQVQWLSPWNFDAYKFS